MSAIVFNAEKHEYRTADGVPVPNVTGILSALVDGQWFTEYARDRGSAVHLATALYDLGTLDAYELDERTIPYIEAYKRFRAESGFVPELIEHVVYEQTLGYAGTLDRAGVMNGKKAIIDIKTGVMSPVTALQLAAYQRCVPEYRFRYGLQLRDDGSYRLTEFSDRNDFNVFAGALALAKWKRNNT